MNRPTRLHLGPRFSEGARLAWLALRKQGWTVSDLRLRLKGRTGRRPLASGVADGWLYGDTSPGAWATAQIEAVLRVPARAWGQKPAQKFGLRTLRTGEG